MQIVGVDWSGQRAREQHHLWSAELDGDGTPGPLTGRTRSDTERYLLELADGDSDLVVGLDFAFSLPAWFLGTCGIDDVDDLWSDGDRLESWLAACEPPFWGRAGRRCPADGATRGWRATELAAAAMGPRPMSVFQIGGAGAVGTGSLRGMPMLSRLRARGFSVWPFDPPRPPVLLEVWPRHHYGGPLVKRHPEQRLDATRRLLPPVWRDAAVASDDAFDAAVTAVGLWRQVSVILAAQPVDHPLAAVEGWIWGVDVPARDDRAE